MTQNLICTIEKKHVDKALFPKERKHFLIYNRHYPHVSIFCPAQLVYAIR